MVVLSFSRGSTSKNQLGISLKNRFGQLGQGNGLEFWQLMCVIISNSPSAVFSQHLFGLFYFGHFVQFRHMGDVLAMRAQKIIRNIKLDETGVDMSREP